MFTTCILCGEPFKKNVSSQKYCGSIINKVGCSWKHNQLQKKGTPEQRKKWKKNQVRKYYPHTKSEKEKFSNRLWRLKIKLSLEEYKNLVLKQKDLCAICGKQEKNKSLAIDHDHTTGKTRGLLCQKCNRALGGFCDDIQVVKNALTYLKNHKS